LKTVDLLTASPTGTRAGISQIPGCLIILEPKVCPVFPHKDCKTSVGFGLIVTAEINFEKCWPVDKATRRPIADESDPRHDRHMRKLESISETRWLGLIRMRSTPSITKASLEN
jgi:nuclear pore complex protein Nup98-Nup96